MAPPTGNVGVSIIVKLTAGLAVSVAPVVTLITPFVTDVTAVIFFVTAMVGTPFDPALQPVKVPRSAWQRAMAVLVDQISATAPVAFAREV